MADDHSSHPDSIEIEMPDEDGGKENDDQLSDSIAEKLTDLKSTSYSRHIFKVPDHLRKGKESAYEPWMLAIGPYHREKSEVKQMEEHKKEYLKEFLERKGNEALNTYVTAMRKLEGQTRSFYADDFSDIKSNEFVEMMLLDGCFIIELLLRRFMDDTMELGDSAANSFNFLSSSIKKLGRDLLLIENQIPFIVLEELFRNWAKKNYNLHEMVLYFFADSVLPDQSKVMGDWAVRAKISTEKSKSHQHLLSFILDSWLREENWTSPWFFNGRKRRQLWLNEKFRRFMRWPNEKFRGFMRTMGIMSGPDEKFLRFMRCATELKEAGIKFKRVHGKSLIDIKFENGTMKIPQLEITGETESIFRNLIVYEQFSPTPTPNDDAKLVSHYIKFMDCLINSQKDVELLCKRNILHNCLGDDETVANMFNKLNDFVTLSPDNYYNNIFVSVNEYCAHRRHTWIANLRYKYFNSPWALISLFAAVLLLVFTLTQTVYSVLAYYYK